MNLRAGAEPPLIKQIGAPSSQLESGSGRAATRSQASTRCSKPM